MYLASIFYTLSLLVLGSIVLSYGIAFKLIKSIPVLSLLLFFVAVFSINFSIVFDMWSIHFIGFTEKVPFIEFRSLFFLLASLFLLYTTWKEDKIKK